MIRRSAIVVIVVLVALIATTSWFILDKESEKRPLAAEKLRLARPFVYYEMTRDHGPSFPLSGVERRLRLVTHGILPPGTRYDPKRRMRYGVRIRIFHDGRLLDDFAIHTETRQSKDRQVGDLWIDENAFTRDPNVQITDDRVLPIYVPLDVPSDSLLQVTLLGDDVREGLIRVYEEKEREQRSRRDVDRALDPRERWEQIWTNTYEPWSMLPEDERLARLRIRTERLTATGESGVDYRLRLVRYTGFRLAADVLEDIGPHPIVIHQHRYAAINVEGPTELSFQVRATSSPQGDDVPTLQIAAIHGDPGADDDVDSEPEPARRFVAERSREARQFVAIGSVPATPPGSPSRQDEPARYAFPIPTGLHSVRLGTRSLAPLEVWVHGPKNRLFGAPADSPQDVGRLYPDYIRIPVYVVGPDRPRSVELAGARTSDPRSQLLKIDVRFFIPPSTHWILRVFASAGLPPFGDPAAESEFSGVLTARFYDRDGRLLDAQNHQRSSVRSPFEWLEFTAESPEPIPVAEPNAIRLAVPRGTLRVELTASRPAALRLFRYLPGKNRYEEPYHSAAIAHDVRWRYARLETRVWWPTRPLNLSLLAGGPESAPVGESDDTPGDWTSQLATLVAQVRLEPGDHGQGEHHDAIVWRPVGQPEQHRIIKRVPDWGPGALAALPLDRAAAYQWQTRTYRDARVYYWLDPTDLGGTLSIEVDGHPAAFTTLDTTSGYITVPGPAGGVHRMRGRSQIESLELLVDLPPAQAPGARSPAVYRQQTVYRFAGEPLRLELVKHSGDVQRLYAEVYGSGDAYGDIEVRGVIGGGNPRRVVGRALARVTTAIDDETIPATRPTEVARFADRGTGSLRYLGRVDFVLGNDLVPGTHVVEVYNRSGHPLWARFFVTNATTPRDGESAVQWKLLDPQ